MTQPAEKFSFCVNCYIIAFLYTFTAKNDKMIKHILTPHISERFANNTHYREGHLRVINALPCREVLGLHIPDIRKIAKQISKTGCKIIKYDGTEKACNNGTEIIRCFENEPNESLCYEETLIWGFLINAERTPLHQRLEMLETYIPILDNWAVCDTFCSDAKWMKQAEKDILWKFLERWFKSYREFEVRFATVASMCYFTDEKWLPGVFQKIDEIDFSHIKSEYKTIKGKPQRAQEGTVQGASPYYVRMGVAWLLATALAKLPNQTREFVRTTHLPQDVIKLYIRKARESFRTRNVEAV
jgi:3-methyladenine DNA glycosylase AlkD